MITYFHPEEFTQYKVYYVFTIEDTFQKYGLIILV